uniref:HDC12190 n=1 Tax=Drosophila melanogaster TaxID=7227 RepID=Q6IKK8_DROME|nr:TPA_inf: HDC12190 [Drosophila melanogaster]
MSSMPMGVVLREEGGLWAVVDGWCPCPVPPASASPSHLRQFAISVWAHVWNFQTPNQTQPNRSRRAAFGSTSWRMTD